MTTFDSEKAAELHRELHSHLPSDPALRVKRWKAYNRARPRYLRKHRRRSDLNFLANSDSCVLRSMRASSGNDGSSQAGSGAVEDKCASILRS